MHLITKSKWQPVVAGNDLMPFLLHNFLSITCALDTQFTWGLNWCIVSYTSDIFLSYLHHNLQQDGYSSASLYIPVFAGPYQLLFYYASFGWLIVLLGIASLLASWPHWQFCGTSTQP